jgi:hypothetical protein
MGTFVPLYFYCIYSKLNNVMSKIICVSGDSFTHEFHQKNEDKWSTKIGANDNIAMGGASNDRIFYSTIEYLNKKTPDILIIGWTVLSRGMLHRNNGSRVIITSHRAFDEQTAENLDEFKKFYYTNIQNDFISFRNVLNYMIFLQEYCKNKKIKLLYFRSVLDVELTDASLMHIASSAYMSNSDTNTRVQGIRHHCEELKKLMDQLDKNIWLKEFWYSMKDHMQKRYGDQFVPGYDKSLPVAAVDDWANLVKQQL